MSGWVRGYFWNAYAVNLLGREFFQQTKNVKLRFYLTFDSAKMINSLFFLIKLNAWKHIIAVLHGLLLLNF